MKTSKIMANMRLISTAAESYLQRASQPINETLNNRRNDTLILPMGNNITHDNAIRHEEVPHSQIAPLNIMNDDPSKIKFPTYLMLDAKIKPIVNNILTVPILNVKQIDDEAAIYVLIGGLFPFYVTKVRKTDEAEEILPPGGCYFLIAMLSFFGSFDITFTNDTASTGLSSVSREVQFRKCATLDEYQDAMDEVTDGDYSDMYTKLVEAGADTASKLYCLLCVCLMTLGKEVNEKNYEKWWSARIAAASSLCLDVNAQAIGQVIPNMDAMQLAHKTYASVFKFRRMIILKMQKYRGKETPFEMIVDLAMRMLMYTEMAHVLAIELYVVIMMPEVMNLQLLRSHEKALDDFINFIKLHRDYLPYVKFLVPQEECNAINRNTLRILHCAAICIGLYLTDSLKNYSGGQQDTSTGRRLKNIIDRYVNAREGYAITGMLESRRNRIGEIEQALMLEAEMSNTQRNTVTPASNFMATLEEIEKIEKVNI